MINECKKDSGESCLDCLKKEYKKLQEQYNLPSFEQINLDFQIEKLSEIETDYLIREIRKFIAERFSNYLRLIEEILNPINSQMFIFTMIKTLSNNDKEKLSEIYKKLSKTEIEILELDLGFNSEKDAEFIRDSYKLWQEIKIDLLKIIKTIKEKWGTKVEKNRRDYFG